MFCLDPSASFEPVPVGVLVKSGFGREDGSGAAKFVSILNDEHRQLLFLEGCQGGIAERLIGKLMIKSFTYLVQFILTFFVPSRS